MITVAGVTVPCGAIARLAQAMQGSNPVIANQLGRAIDANVLELLLHPRDAERILAALDTSPVESLEPLRRQLRAHDRKAKGVLYLVPAPTPSGHLNDAEVATG